MEPMRGIRIIDATAHASGPMATGMLADQGADVIRWEPLAGDASRHVGGVRGGVTAYTAYLNRNKRSMAVDLTSTTVRPYLYQLIETADGYIAMIIIGDTEFHGACRALGLASLLSDERFRTLTDRFTHYAALFAELERVAVGIGSDVLLARLE
jgi:crotonobetainyl-CoA:carnitine CoA-transferase CaiB-like acyl-CoA transferase